MQTKQHIQQFRGSKGIWKLVGTTSTGRYTCTDTYKIESGEFQDIDRNRLHELIKQKKLIPL